MRSTVLLTLLCVTVVTVYAQDYRPNLIPPSPDATALGKYADHPVGLYTGTLPISIPICTVTDGSLQVPVNLSYHASGNRIEDASSFAGLGWTLNAGGAIMRSVRNLPDDYPVKGFLDYSASYSFNYLENDPNRYPQWQEIANGCADAEPDAYFFNVNGYTGKFTFDWSGNIISDCKSAWKIEAARQNPSDPDKITGWKMTADDGTSYFFLMAEQATIVNNGFACQTGLVYNSAWYLSHIFSPNSGRTISFAYENYTTTFDVNHSVTHRIYAANPAACEGTAPAPSSNYTKLSYTGCRVRSITSSDNATTVMFNYLTARTDEPGTALRQLDEIIIKNKDNAEIRKFTLGYDYSTGRLSLRSLKKTGTSEPPYQFFYHSEVLPPRTANGGGAAALGQDHWGYYNGKTDNASLLPSVWKPDASGNLIFYKGGDRSPDETKVWAGMLTKISYPAGAVDEFYYQLHEYGYIGNQTVASLGEFIVEKETIYNEYNVNAGGIYPYPPASSVSNIQTVSPVIYGETGGDAVVTIDWKGRRTVSQVNSGYVQVSKVGAPPNTPPVFFKEFNNTDQTGKTVLTLPYGQYEIKAVATHYTTGPSTIYDQAWITLSWKSKKTNHIVLKKKKAGGLRITSVYSYAYPGDRNHTFRDFQYLGNAADESSGVLNWESKYELKNLKYYAAETACSYDLRISRDRTVLGNGPHIGYSTVTELSGLNGANGKTTYSFLSEIDHPPLVNNASPLQLPTSHSNSTGNLVSQHTYKKENTNYLPVTEMTTPADSTRDNNFVKGMKIRFDGGTSNPSKFYKGVYETRLGLWRPIEIREKEYGSDGSVNMEKRKGFVYDNSFRYVKELRMYLNSGLSDYEQVNYYYPKDFTSPTTAVQDMISKNMVGIPLEVVKLKVKAFDPYVTGAVYTQYTSDASLKVFPQQVKKLQLAEPASSFDYAFDNSGGSTDPRYASESTFEKYDAKENLLQLTGRNGITSSFCWDKHNANPIVTATDVAWDKLAYSGFENTDPVTFGAAWTLSGSYSTAEFATGKRSYNGTVTVNTSGFPAVNHVLSFWMKGSAAFTVNGSSVPASSQWTLYETKITGGSTVNINTQGGFIDELRIYPENARLITYAYDQLIGLNTVADVKSKPSFQESDQLWRPRLVKDHNKDIVKRINYEYDILVPLNLTLTASLTGDYTYQFQVQGGSAGYNYEWDFDDLSTQTTGTSSVSHTFPTLTLKYSVKVKVKNGANVLGVLSAEVLAAKQGNTTACNEIQKPEVTVSTANSKEFTFKAPALNGVAYIWDFADNTTPGAVAQVSHLYTNPGPYEVTLTVAAGGKSCSKKIPIKVAP